jgi:hypothetical protein
MTDAIIILIPYRMTQISSSFPSISRSGIKPGIPPKPTNKSVEVVEVCNEFATTNPVAAPTAASMYHSIVFHLYETIM